MHVYMYVCVYMCVYMHIYIEKHRVLCMCICMYIYIYIYVCMCVYVASAVIGLIKWAPDTGLRVTPMIPPWNSLAVGGVATCTVVSPQ